MNRQTNFSRNTIGANANANAGKIMKQAVEIQLGSSSGKTMFQNLTQLDGAVIVTISIVPPKISSYSAQTYDSNIPTLDDYKAMFFTFLRQDVQILENIPALDMNPYNDNDSATATTANNNPFWDQNFSPQIPKQPKQTQFRPNKHKVRLRK